jgi:hypothetical protein
VEEDSEEEEVEDGDVEEDSGEWKRKNRMKPYTLPQKKITITGNFQHSQKKTNKIPTKNPEKLPKTRQK